MKSKFNRLFPIGLFALLFLIACKPTQRIPKTPNADKPVIAEGLKQLEITPKALNFFVVGDWGRDGADGQREVAEMMNQAGYIIAPDFIISVGDNFYPKGVSSVDDVRFKDSYEDIYNGENLFCPWYIALGNHDYQGDPEAQIAYAKISERWNMPARYFTVNKKLKDKNGAADFIFIDTSPFEDAYYNSEKYISVTAQDTTAQKEWFIKEMKSSDANWKIVIGHHPFYTSGLRKNYTPYVRFHLDEVLQTYKADAYFAGHEHDLQHQKPENLCTHHFVSGAGSSVRATGTLDYTKFAESVSGFMIISLTATIMKVQVVDWHGNVLYQTDIPKEADKIKP